MEFIEGRSFTKQQKQIFQANDKLHEGVELHTKTSGSPLNIETSKQTHGIMMEHWGGKNILVGVYRNSSAFAAYHIFARAGLIERYLEGTIFRFREIQKDDPTMAATNLFGNIVNIHPFEDGN